MILRVLIVALVAVGGWGWWQHQSASHWRADAAHWRAEAETATARAEQAAHAHEVAAAALRSEQSRNREYAAMRDTITESDNEEPVADVISRTLRSLCARDPDCRGGAKGASRTAPAVRRTGPAR